MTIGLVDTTIFCEVLPVPGLAHCRDEVLDMFERYIRDRVTLLLPVATIIEAGNHIAHIPDGRLRRTTAEKFVVVVRDALGNVGGPAPWTVPQPLLSPQALQDYLDQFPDYAMQGIGLGDLSIVKEFENQCRLHRARRVFIWSLDGHLSAYDRPAEF